MHLFHKWKRFYVPVVKKFLGEKYNDLDYSGIRTCMVCGKYQHECYYGDCSIVYETLDNKQVEIIERKIKDGLLVTKD